MPVTLFRVRWPDQSETLCYSPSRVVKDFLAAGERYALDDFGVRTRAALGAASERVRGKYGFACSRAAAELAQIEARLLRYRADPKAEVEVLEID